MLLCGGRTAACGLLVILLAACVGPSIRAAEVKPLAQTGRLVGGEQSAPRLLIPWQTLSGAPLVSGLDANGFPLAGSEQGYATLTFPSALAVRSPDLYIADSGSRRLYRFNTAFQVMSVVPDEEAKPWTQIQVGHDRSLYVLDSADAVIRHHPPGGQPLRMLKVPAEIAGLDRFVLNERLNGVVASDNLGHRLVVLSPISGTVWPADQIGKNEFTSLTALASDGRTVYAIDRGCNCVIAIDESGRVRARIGQRELLLPLALAVDRYGHIFVSDASDRTLKVFLHDQLLVSYAAHKLRCSEITALAIDEDVLYLADGPGAQVLSFHILPSPPNSSFVTPLEAEK